MVSKKKISEEEQLAILREILAELKRLNANLERRPAPETSGGTEEEDDSEELDYFE